MSIDPKKFGLSDSLVNAVNEALKGSQHKIDVAEPKGKITGADFKKLRGEGAKPDFLDLDKDGNKKEPMKHAAKQTKEEVEQVIEAIETTHENPLVTVHDKDGLHTHANLSTANKIFNTNVKHTDVHKGAVTVTSGHKDKNKLKFAISKHHATKVRKVTKEEVEQVDELSKATMGSYVKKASDSAATHTGAAAAYGSSSKSPDPKKMAQHQAVATKRKTGIATAVGKLTKEEAVVEADDAVAKQINAKKEAMKKQIQQKIAQKQMSAMQAKANKRLSTISASSHTDKEDEKEKKKGGKEVIEVNPPLKEASDLPKSVVKKGHEIAKSLIKRRADVREPYAVGMAAAKKSAGIKD